MTNTQHDDYNTADGIEPSNSVPMQNNDNTFSTARTAENTTDNNTTDENHTSEHGEQTRQTTRITVQFPYADNSSYNPSQPFTSEINNTTNKASNVLSEKNIANDSNTPATTTQFDNGQIHQETQPIRYHLAPEYGAIQDYPSVDSTQSTQQTQPIQPVQTNPRQQEPNNPFINSGDNNYTNTMRDDNPFVQRFNDDNINNVANSNNAMNSNHNDNNDNNTSGNRTPKRGVGTGAIATVAVVSALFASALTIGGGVAAVQAGWLTIPTSTTMNSINTGNTGGKGTAALPGGAAPNWTEVSKKVAQSVVSIQAQSGQNADAGSGAIIDKEGHIITNNHVINNAQKVQVTLANGQIYDASIVGADKTTDLAVLQLKNPPKDLAPVTFANSNNLAVGEPIMAIGNPLGYENTATTGIVSALNRPVAISENRGKTLQVTNAVQIDAAINPGNSGGPTFNAAGEVIGINSSIASMQQGVSQEAGSIGIGFAIPSNLAKRIADNIIKDGKVTHVQLGVMARTVGVKVEGATRAGVELVDVNANSPAARAGLHKGDVIIGYDGKTVSSLYSLLGYIRAASMNQQVNLSIVRNGQLLNIQATLNEQEQQQVQKQEQQQPQQQPKQHENEGGNDDENGFLDPFGLLDKYFGNDNN